MNPYLPMVYNTLLQYGYSIITVCVHNIPLYGQNGQNIQYIQYVYADIYEPL